jgi:hypothetical protein
MENMPQMADFVYKFYNQKLIAYQEKKRVRFFTQFSLLFFYYFSARRIISL